MRVHMKRNLLYVVWLVSCFVMVRVIQVGLLSHSLSSVRGGDGAGSDDKLVPLVEPQSMVLVNRTETRIGDNYPQGPCFSHLLDMPNSVRREDPTTFSDVTCAALLRGSDKDAVYDRAHSFMKKYPAKKVPDETISMLSKDCKKLQSTRGYHMEAGSPEEEHFPIAYNILVHKDAYQFERLLRAVYRPQNQYCVHVDAKQPASFRRAIIDLVACFGNVFLASRAESVVYAGFTRLQADITCMSDHLASGQPWKYLLNVAGQAFPIKTNREMVQILKIYNGSNDIEGITGGRIHKTRFEVKWIEKGGKMEKTTEKNPKPPHNIEIVRGSAYGVFSREFVHFIINDERAQALLSWSRFTWSPDEHYWATLHHTYYNPHLHTPGGYNGKPDSKRWLAVWVAWGGESKCHGKWVRGICVFGVGDLPKIASREEFFINKLYYDYEPLTLECLNNDLEERVACPRDVNTTFYQGLPFVRRTWG